MNILVIYKSKTGFTKEYAEQIAQALACDALPFESITEKEIRSADVMIFGSRIHAGRVDGLPKVKKMLNDHPGKALIVFATGATPMAADDVVQGIWNDNLSEAEKEAIPHFYFQSGLRYERMSFIDRTLMKAVARLMGKKKDKTETEAMFGDAIQQSYDNTSSEYVLPLVNYVKERFR